MKSFNIKRTIAATLTAAMLTTSTAGLAESATSALDAFNALTGQSVSLATAAAADPHQSLVKVMAGQFAAAKPPLHGGDGLQGGLNQAAHGPGLRKSLLEKGSKTGQTGLRVINICGSDGQGG